jgi:predicted nucleic acid-binding protein
MIVLDSSVIYALLDRRDRRHGEAVAWYGSTEDDLVTTPMALAEVDHLARTRSGSRATSAFRQDVKAGAYHVEWWPEAGAESAAVAEQYADLQLGMTDASLIALAARFETTDIATFDERPFRAVRPIRGPAAFRLLPADS